MCCLEVSLAAPTGAALNSSRAWALGALAMGRLPLTRRLGGEVEKRAEVLHTQSGLNGSDDEDGSSGRSRRGGLSFALGRGTAAPPQNSAMLRRERKQEALDAHDPT